MVNEQEKQFSIGDLVAIDTDNPAWEHLNEKENDHPLRLHGVITQSNEKTYIVKFDGWTVYLKESDIVKVS